MIEIPVISSHVLHGMPAFVRQEIGQKALSQANRAAGFDLELAEGRNCFIPQSAVLGFVNAVARAAGEPNFGGLMAPVMDAANYGSYGRHVIGAETLGEAIARAIAALRYHSTNDKMSLEIVGDEARYGYQFSLAGRPGYDIIASAAAGVLLSLFKSYLPADWKPLRVELDIGKPRQPGLLEDVFNCPVHFDAPTVTIVAERRHLSFRSRHPVSPLVTIEDVVRDRHGGAPRDLLSVVMEQIRAQVLSGCVSIESAAQSMDTSIRTLQRELNRAGTDFRRLANAMRYERATELLQHTNGSITRVAAEMGYSSPANFARAFRKAAGHPPSDSRSKT